jgi:choline dehydrogenase-like flavoprotein
MTNRNEADWIRFWASPEGIAASGFRSSDGGLAVAVERGVPTVDVVPTDVEVIIIGAGAGGGVMAERLAAAGRNVLVVEWGSWLSFDDLGRNHLVNQRVAFGRHSAGPFEEAPRVVINPDGTAQTVMPWDPRYHANAATIGGGTRVYGGQAWRFNPLDFQMASTYGIPEGSSLADWPISYADLAPHYDRIEHDLGVCGSAVAMTHLPTYQRDYPMPPISPLARTDTLSRAAEGLGWSTLPPPLAINSAPRDSRPACTECAYCVGFACPVDAKNGSHNTFLPRAVASGNANVLSRAMVTKINIVDGKASGITLVRDGHESVIRAATVVCCAGAIETARLLMLSGVDLPMLGRNLQGHVYVAAVGRMTEQVREFAGPGPSIASNQWLHGNDGIIGGGMLLDDFVPLPVAFWQMMDGRPRPTSDDEIVKWMRTYYLHTIDIKGPIQDIPSPESRVTLDPSVTDAFGLPVARLSGATHPESIRSAAFLKDKAVEWLQAAGAVEAWGLAPTKPYLSGGQHQAGTCRMGEDPTTSVVDPAGRIHGLANVLVADTSVHVTNGGVNPFLTAMALADRTATLLARP